MAKGPKPTSPWFLRLHPFLRDLGLTGATQFGATLLNMFTISLFGRLMGPAALGEYLLLRRVVAWLQSGVQPASSLALPRYVASIGQESPGKREGYLLTALAFDGTLALCLFLVLNAGQGLFARWAFGSTAMAHLVLPLSLLVLGLAVHAAVYGYYRGRLAMNLANGLQLCNLGVVPIVAVAIFYPRHSVAIAVDAMGVLTLLCCALFALPLLPRLKQAMRWLRAGLTSELLRYGIVRLPGDFGLGALMALAPIMASHVAPASSVAYLLLGGSILTGIGGGAAALGTLLLPKVSMMQAQNRLPEIRLRLEQLRAALLEIGLFGGLQLIVFADVIVRLWVGPRFSEGIFITRIVLVAFPFFVFYSALRSVIDAAAVTPYNARNIIMALAVLVVFAGLVTRVVWGEFLLPAIAAAWVIGFAVLAWLTGRTLRQLFGLPLPWRQSGLPLVLALILGFVSFSLRWAMGFRTGALEFILIEIVVCSSYAFLLKKLGCLWMPYLLDLVTVRSASAEGRQD